MNRLSDYFEMIITAGIKEIEFHDAYERFMLIEKVNVLSFPFTVRIS